jgi:hypothetical protein
MAFNGSGTYNLPAGNPVVTGTTISSSTTNTTNSDIATALTNCITRDGQSTPSANLPMNAKKLTGLAAGTSAGDSVRYEQVVLTGGALGTPTSGTLTSCTGLPLTTGVTGTLPVANGGTGSTSTTYCSLATNVTGTLPVGNGGTNSTATPTAGGAGYGTGTAHAYTAAGTSGQVLTSNGTSAPTWATPTTSGGTVTSVAATVPAFLSVSGSPITSSGTLAISLSGTALPVANGGTGTTTPALVAGTNVTISGTWPNQTINATSSGGSAATPTALGTVFGKTTQFSEMTYLGVNAGAARLTTGNNTFIGADAGAANTAGNDNIHVGYSAGAICTTAYRNTIIGSYAMKVNTTGSGNVVVGYESGATLTTGDDNTIIGNQAGTPGSFTGSRNICIGYTANPSSGSVSDTATIGTSGITVLRCAVTTITAISDARDKTNILPIAAGLDFTNQLNPVSFDWNMRDGGKVGVSDTGFIAQDLQAVQEKTGIEIPGLVYADNPEKLEAGYSKLLPVMVKAIQELSAKIDALQAEITQLKGA